MKRYTVIFETSAQENVRESYDWGCRAWGKKEAQRWVRDLRTAIVRQLSIVPKGFPLAPEDDEFAEEIASSSWVYRILFTIRKSKVHVLHVRGSYNRK